MASIKPIYEKKKACVIGGTGFVASLLIKQLLEKGYAVNTTVRDPGNSLSLPLPISLRTTLFGFLLVTFVQFNKCISLSE